MPEMILELINVWLKLVADWVIQMVAVSVYTFLFYCLSSSVIFLFPVIISLPFCFIADAESRVSMYQRKVLWPTQKNTFHHLFLVFDGRFVVHVGICMCKTLLIVLLVATLTDCYEQRWFGSNAWRISSGTLISYL